MPKIHGSNQSVTTELQKRYISRYTELPVDYISKKINLPVGSVFYWIGRVRNKTYIPFSVPVKEHEIREELKAIINFSDRYPSFRESAKARVKVLMDMLEHKYKIKF